MSLSIPDIYAQKADYSQERISELRTRLTNVDAARRIPDLSIFVAGSYARLEASSHSDLDPFFICRGDRSAESSPRTNELEMFGELIQIGKEMEFPKFSGDARYLEVHAADDVQLTLGSPDDDARNHFTLRLLMILESAPLYGEDTYHTILADFVDAYFRDYPDHQTTFEPTFLVNDILRYWRTVLANYEHLRNQSGTEEEKIQQKIKNYKLKYSRLTTCFATVAALAALDTPVEPQHVHDIIRMTPHKRLLFVADRKPDAVDNVQEIISGYATFLELTERSKADLETHFGDKARRSQLFGQASTYGDTFYRLLQTLDQLNSNAQRGLLRTLVV